jgi:pimeloyl-ACP methyl ester carboxylesterase
VFVHGLSGSHLNWCLVGPHLAAGRRAVALDLRGFGLTPGLRVNSTVRANTRLLDRFIREVVGTPVILVGNSMGGLISILETAANPDVIKAVVLIDPALPPPPQKPDWQMSGRRPESALGVRYPRRCRAHPAARGPRRRYRSDPGLAGPNRRKHEPCSS